MLKMQNWIFLKLERLQKKSEKLNRVLSGVSFFYFMQKMQTFLLSIQKHNLPLKLFAKNVMIDIFFKINSVLLERIVKFLKYFNVNKFLWWQINVQNAWKAYSSPPTSYYAELIFRIARLVN